MIPHVVLEAIGNPSFIDISWKEGDNRLLFRGSKDTGTLDVPDELYDEGSYLVLPSPSPLIDEIGHRLGWDEYTYAVECRLVKGEDDKVYILCDLGTAQEAEPEQGKLISPRCLDYLYDDEEDAKE